MERKKVTNRSVINDPLRRTSAFNSSKNKYNKKERKKEITKKKHVKLKKDSNKNNNIVENFSINANVVSFASVGSAVASEKGTTLLGYTKDNPLEIDFEIFRNHEFPFENIVLEGGGIKGLAYAGALMVLEEANILKNIKRICGASAGSIIALLFAVGYSTKEMKEIMFNSNLTKKSTDHKCGIFSLLPNLRRKFGWNPAKSFLKWMKDLIEAKLGNRYITFKQLFEETCRELCIVVTNVSRMSEYYCHVKTTPNMEIATAVRMSISFPGWWLSLKPEDSFFRRMDDLDKIPEMLDKKNRFGEWNNKTLGMLLFSENETEVMRSELTKRKCHDLPKPSPTKLYRKRQSSAETKEEKRSEQDPVVKGFTKFLQALHDVTTSHIITEEDFQRLYETGKFEEEDRQLIFGEGDLNTAFREIDDSGDGEITFDEVLNFMESKGVDLQARFHGYARREIETFGDFISTLGDMLLLGLMKANVEHRDVERTIGINTGYIQTNDYDIEDGDKNYLWECGIRGAIAYLREYISKTSKDHYTKQSLMSITVFEERHSKTVDELLQSDPIKSENLEKNTGNEV